MAAISEICTKKKTDRVDSEGIAFLSFPSFHCFRAAFETLTVSESDYLIQYIYIPSKTVPREIMLEWRTKDSWEHRAYWGENLIGWGIDGTPSRKYQGPIPTERDQWVRLEVKGSDVDLKGKTINGWAYSVYNCSLHNGSIYWDYSGLRTSASTCSVIDKVWLDDSLPTGARADGPWNWTEDTIYSGIRAHKSALANGVIFLGYDIGNEKVHAGDTCRIAWYWKCVGDLGHSFTIWVEIQDRWENPMFLSDAPVIIPGTRDTIVDTFEFQLPERLKNGQYMILIKGGAVFFEEKFYHFKVIGSLRTTALGKVILGPIEVE